MQEQRCMCVCVNGEGFLLFLSFQCDQFFFQQWQWLWPQPQDAAYYRYALDWQQQCPTKKQLASFQRHPCTLIFVYTIMSHPMNANLSPYQQPHSLRKKTQALNTPTFGDGMLQKGAMQGFSQFTHLTKGCTQIAETHRHGGIGTATSQVADGWQHLEAETTCWSWVVRKVTGWPRLHSPFDSGLPWFYFTKGPMPQSLAVILLNVFLSTPYRHDAYQHNSPWKEELKMQFFFTAPRKDVHHGARFANGNPRWCPPRESPISVEEDDNFVGVRPPHCRSQARSVSENRVIGWCWNYCMVPCDFWMMTRTHRRFLLDHWMLVNSNHWSNQSYSHKYGQSDKERESLFNETCHSADSCSD